MKTSHDAIVIGAGQAGPTLAARLAKSGLDTVLIERRHLGGTCVNDGCTPTKTLVASARVAHMARRSADFGIVSGPVHVDFEAVMARKDRIVAQSISSLGEWLRGIDKLEMLAGHARFVGPRQLQVGERVLEADKIFINVGARPTGLDWPGIASVPVLDNASLLELETLPEHLIIVGGSYIGLEFAQMFRRFGSRVTLLEVGDRLIAREDPDVSAEVQAILEREGIEFAFGVDDARVAAHGRGLQVVCRAQGKPLDLHGSHLLAAVGRRPNTDDLGLEQAGIQLDDQGYIKVDDRLYTGVPGVWALGDVNGRGAFTHTSYNDHEVVADNLLDGADRSIAERPTAYALYIDPPLGRVGMNEAQARKSGRTVLSAKMPMQRVGRARERSETQGFMKVLVDAQTEKVLGASLLGIAADEVVHLFVDAISAGASYRRIQHAVHIHPTVSELIPTLLGQLEPLAEDKPDAKDGAKARPEPQREPQAGEGKS